MNSPSYTIVKRATAIFHHLMDHLGEYRTVDQIKLALKESGDPVDKHSIRAAAFYLKHSLCPPAGYDVHVKKQGYILEPVKISRYIQRTAENLELKMGLGNIFWKWLLNFSPNEVEDKKPEYEYKLRNHQDFVRGKLAALRARAILSIIADAGSSVSAVISTLLDAESIPIRPSIPEPTPGEKDEREAQSRLVTPYIITNSLSIASMVSESVHAGTIGLTVVGGRYQTDLSSISGDLTDQCLKAWGASGSWKSDLAIIGTTGCWEQPSGIHGFACDDLNEARLKASLLEMAYFRAIVMDSSKLKAPPISGKVFAPLTATALDLLVIDDGQTTGAASQVAELSEKAGKAGVAVLALATKTMKPDGKA